MRGVADDLLADLAPVDPAAADALGGSPPNRMPLVAPEHLETRRAANARVVRRLDALGPTAEDRALRLALGERAASEVALHDAGFTPALLAPLATPVHAIREVFDDLPRGNAEDWVRIGEHLDLVPGALADYAATLDSASRVVPLRQVLAAAAQCEKWVSPHGDDFYRRLVAGRPALAAAADAASEATQRFADVLRRRLAPRASRDDAAGADLYRVTSAAFLGERVDLEETYAFGWAELARLTEEMRGVARDLGHGTIEDAARALDADVSRRLHGADAVRDWLQRRVEETVDALDGKHVDLPPRAGRPECRISPTAVGVMYYSAPDPAFTRPGRIWWAPPAGGTAHTWREVTTVHHEGVPGHHLQITTALAEPGLHPWQRSMCHVHGHAEGWAHYAERWADEVGLLRDPGERLGMLYGQRWRAARIVIDMGLHLRAAIPPGNGLTVETRWTPDVGVAVLQAASGCDVTTARFEIDRYLGWPAQALAFRVGARLWRELRAASERRPGHDARTFHREALRRGPMGLGPLRTVLTEEPR